MRVAAVLLIVGLAGTGVVWMKPAAPSVSSAGLATQSEVGKALAETSAKMQLTALKNPDLQLQPDQTATVEVTVTYPTIVSGAPPDYGQKQTQQPRKRLAKETKATVKQGPKKKGEQSKPGQNQPPGQVTTSESAMAVKFYLNMNETEEYPACVASVTPLIGEPSLKPGDAPLNVPISITSCNPKGGKGTLFLSGTKAPGVAVTLKQRSSLKLFAIVLVSLIAAVLICVVCGIVVSTEGHEMRDVMAPVSWDFSTSWASNITAFGTAFSFLLSISVFPDKLLFASKGEYQFVTFFATALVALAPAVYKLTSPSTVTNSANGPVVSTAGFVRGFIIASAFTIWGALLQTLLELLIVFELARAGTVYLPIVGTLGACIVTAGIFLIAYCWKNLQSIIAANSTRSGPPAAVPREAFSLAAPNIGMVKTRKAAVL